ncbi:hypothetical protein ARMGADRAFT_1084528 [Armillaria gallica]|uniref:Uncharacterized protein n=1 Tax=Armillaria gallica TaxID=47427 RepID=A0A2H3DHL1_ARMGA|nr:hypothetical protein ARMGADRAFT_1084528 [Armillaria gallica]
MDAYGTDAPEHSSALALYLCVDGSHRSTLIRPFPSPHRLLLTPVYAASPRSATCKSASFIALFGCLSVTSMLLACSELSALSARLPSAPLSPNQGRVWHHRRLHRLLRELLASEPKAVTVIPIGAF